MAQVDLATMSYSASAYSEAGVGGVGTTRQQGID